MTHSYNWERIVCLTAGNGCYAVAACVNRIPGIFVCMTETHRLMLVQHVIKRIFQLKQSQECHNLYNPALVAAITGKDAPAATKKTESQAYQSAPITPTKAKQSEATSSAKSKPKTTKAKPPPKKKKKGSDGYAIKTDDDEDESGMWTSSEE